MAVYYTNTYDITDIKQFQKYPPKVRPLLVKYGAEVIAMDTKPICLEGAPRMMNAIIKFPSEEAALSCYNDPDYEPVKQIRLNSTKNCTMILVKEFKQEEVRTVLNLHISFSQLYPYFAPQCPQRLTGTYCENFLPLSSSACCYLPSSQ